MLFIAVQRAISLQRYYFKNVLQTTYQHFPLLQLWRYLDGVRGKTHRCGCCSCPSQRALRRNRGRARPGSNLHICTKLPANICCCSAAIAVTIPGMCARVKSTFTITTFAIEKIMLQFCKAVHRDQSRIFIPCWCGNIMHIDTNWATCRSRPRWE